MPRSISVFIPLVVLSLNAADRPNNDLERRFAQTVQPFVKSYCLGCHSGAKPASQFDLSPYSTMAAVVKDYAHWNLVLEKLEAGQMPPKGLKQPSTDARQQVIKWIEAMRTSEAQKNAGDPGVVLARRLSNAEYNYTIRDLTGVDLRPTREFPVDPANTAGFDNSGESLTMSPALLNKYLQAAREVANHMVLTPEHSCLPRIRCSSRPTGKSLRSSGSSTSMRGSPPITPITSRPRGATSTAPLWGNRKHHSLDFASEAKVSPKYLPMVWQILEDTQDEAGPLAKLRGMWRALPAPAAKQARGTAREMRRDARLRCQDPQAHGNGVQVAGCTGLEPDVAAADELEVPPIQRQS